MKKTKPVLCLLLIFALLFTFAACGKGDSPAAPKDETADTPADSHSPAPEPSDEPETIPSPDDGLTADPFVLINDVEQVLDRPHQIQPGTVATFHGNDVPAYMPWNATAEQWLLKNIYEGLVYCYMDRPDDIRPLIAESWHVSDDYLTWTFKIRDDIKFTNGTVCDAEAISASWDYFREAYPSQFLNHNIQSWEARVYNIFVVQLSAPCAYIESIFAELYIVSPNAVAQYGINDNRAAVGTAPYYVKERITDNKGKYPRGLELICSANPEYYLYERMPVIETIVYKFIYDEQTKLDNFLSGEYDAFFTSTADSYNKLLESGFNGTLLRGYNNSFALFFNAETMPEFQVYEVRKAFNRLIDLDALNNELYSGLGLVQTSIWTVDSSGEVPWPEGFYYDSDEGFALLAAAGIDAQSLNLKVKTFEPAIYEALSHQLAGKGINMEVFEANSEAGFIDDLMLHIPIDLVSFNQSHSKPFLMWNYILLPEHLMKSIWSDLYDPELYETLCSTYETMVTAPTWDEMLTYCKVLTDMVQKDYAAIPGVQEPYFAAFNKDLKGIVMITEQHTLLWHYLYF